MQYTLSIELFGGLRIRRGDEIISRFRTQKTASLLAYIAFNTQRSHPREELIELLWPESDPEAGRTSLRTALAALRKQIEPEGGSDQSVLLADRQFVQLDSGTIVTDVQRFEMTIHEAEREADDDAKVRRLEAAAALYRGPLLPGFYEDWVQVERERLQRKYVAAMRVLAAAHERAGSLTKALELAHRVVTADPLVEESHMHLVRLYASSGQANTAARQFREMERLLRREVGAQPSQRSRAELEMLLRPASTGDSRSPATIPESKVESAAASAQAPVGELPDEPVPEAPAAPLADSARQDGPAPIVRPMQPRLPVQLTPFIGREEELGRIIELVSEDAARLLTLTGMAGSGKTRLGIEAARNLAPAFHGAVWFAGMADVPSSNLIAAAIARSLGLEGAAEADAVEQIARTMGDRRILIVVDNFEHLAEEGAAILLMLLERMRGLSLLVTSRQRLDIGGEVELAVQPLPVPTLPGLPEQLEQYAGVRLFVDRARASRPGFQLSRDNAAAVAALCEQLEGLPLALELAAAWASTLTPAQMLSRLSQRFDLLTSRRRDLPPRHRTLRAAIEWSDHLLDADLRRFFSHLSVFRGGFTLDAAEAVCGEPMALSYLLQLRERSLVVAAEVGEEMRYRLLETLREFALEQVTPPDRAQLSEAHAAYYTALADRGGVAIRGPARLQWLNALEPEQDNFRAALSHCLTAKDAVAGLRMAAALAPFWAGSGYVREGLDRLEDLLALDTGGEPRLRANALLGAALLAEPAGNAKRQLDLLVEARDLYTGLDDKEGMALSIGRMHHPVYHEERDLPRAVGLLETALTLAEESRSTPATAEVLASLGNMARDDNQFERAGALYSRSLGLYRSLGDLHGVALVLGDMGYMYTGTEEFDRAEAACVENLSICRELRNKVSTSHALWLLGRVAEARDELARARELLEEAVAISRDSGHRQEYYNALFQLAIVAEREGEFAEARDLYSRCTDIAVERESARGILMGLYSVARSSARMGDTAAARSASARFLQVQAGRPEIRGLTGTLSTLGQAAFAEGRPEEAAALLGAVKSRLRAGDSLVHLARWTYDQALSEVRAGMREADFQRFHDAGSSLSPDDALRLAHNPELLHTLICLD